MRLIIKGAVALFLLLAISIPLSAQYIVQGVVTDSLTREPLSYVSVRLKNTTEGTTTGSDGRFYFKTHRSEGVLVISTVGYNEYSRLIHPARNLSYKVALSPATYALNEVLVKPKREHYRKKDNPAVEFVRRMIEHRDDHSPNEKDFWQRDRYEKTTFALNNFDEEKQKKWLYRKFDFLTEYVDTSAVTGKPILTVSARELLATDYYRKSPHSEKQWVKGRKQAGVDEFLSKQGMQAAINEVFKDVDIYENNISLFTNKFVSPLSRIGTGFYKYYLMDTLQIGGETCADLAFTPFNSESFGFNGHLYVTLDSTYFVKRAVLNFPKKINLNFVDYMLLEQEFKRAEDGTRLLDHESITVEFKLTEGQDAKGGVEPQSETVWRQADEYKVPRMVYVNKMDTMGADFFRCIKMLHDRLHANGVAIQLPIGQEDTFRGIVDLVDMNAEVYYDDMGNDMRTEPIPEDMVEQAEEYRNILIEAVAENDEVLMEKYLEGEEITREELKAAIRKETIANTLVPVVCGSSYKNRGVQKLLDAIVDYMPAPTDVEDIKGVNPETEEQETRPSSDDAPFAALAFKIATDPFVGKLAYFRVYSGKVEAGTTVYNSVKDARERMGRILQMHSNHRKDIDCCYAGDIAAVVGLKNTTTGDTLCDENHPIILESMKFPEPVIRVAIEPKTKAGNEKMGIALAKLAEEDPTFKTYTDEETGQTIIAGMGELHLEIIVDRLLREFKVEANVGAPQVAYRETIRKEANQETKYARQSGGKGQYGHVKIKIEPNEPGKGYEFVNAIVGGAIPKEYIPAIDNGIQGAMKSGVLAGYPVVDVKVTLWDGSYHEVDSSEMAFSIAGSMAFKDAMRKADPIITEPIMKVAVIVPDEYLGDVIGDLNARRGQIQGMEAMAGTQRVNAFVPLAQMFGYATDLRSKTQGRGQYVMEPSHYEPVPKNIADQIIAGRTKG